jgi:hypothetical protein
MTIVNSHLGISEHRIVIMTDNIGASLGMGGMFFDDLNIRNYIELMIE